MNLIVNVDKNWAIGYKGKLLVSIPEDMKFFPFGNYGKGGCAGTQNSGNLPERSAA